MQTTKTDSHWQTLAVLAVMIALIILIYANALDAPFVFDDMPNIVDNPHLRLTAFTPERLTGAIKGPSGNRPFAFFSFALNYFFHGYTVNGYRLVNLIIHLITGMLVFLTARQTLYLTGTDNRFIPVFAAVLWLSSPIHTQSVTYIVQRMTAMATMFYLLAMFLYIKTRLVQRDFPEKKTIPILLFTGCAVAGILGLGSKEIAATLPLFLLLYEWFFFQNLNGQWMKQRLLWICIACVAIVAIAAIYLGTSPIEKILGMYDKQDFTMGQRLLTQPGVVLYYLSLLLFPHPGRLNLDYDFPVSTLVNHPLTTALTILAIAGLLMGAISLAKKHRLLSFAILWFLGTLVVESSFLGLALVFEHRIYLPSVFVLIALTAALLTPSHSRRVGIALLCTATVVSCFWTYQRNRIWTDSISLWKDCIAKAPDNGRPYNGLGGAFQEAGDYEKAQLNFEKAIHLNPDDYRVNNNLGALLLGTGKPMDAIPYFQKALTINPEYHEAYCNLGVALDRINQQEEAIRSFEKALAIYPDYAEAHNNLGSTLLNTGKPQAAIFHFKKAVRINPLYPEAYSNLGLALMNQKKVDQAIGYYQKSLKLSPESANTHFNLGSAYFMKGDIPKAIHHLEQSAAINPASILVLNNLSTLYTMDKQYDKAIAILDQIEAQLPANPTVHYNKACVYSLAGRKEAAVTSLENAIRLGYNKWHQIRTDSDLENIRDTAYYKKLEQAVLSSSP
ncbi:MAG: tetratricopeptide repeat protein [Thermodesulfobacteriota bacterium]|nr:tetratricopeptide repeat protein [Thermodesulfobacteriota bacterium]